MAIKNQEEFEQNFISAEKKIQNGATIEDLTKDEIEAWKLHQKLQQQAQGEDPNDFRTKIAQFAQMSQQHKGNRVIHITDTEADPDDLEKILDQNLAMTGGLLDKDVFVHTGDMLSDFINFQNKEQFRVNRIISEGGLEGVFADEFKKSYEYMLEHNGIADYDLMGGQMTQEMAQGLQRMYTGEVPLFLNNEERDKYKENYAKFKKHFSTAIKNDARNKYKGYKKALQDRGLTPENTLLLEGNHDVPEVMREVLGEYMVGAGGVANKRGLKIGVPLNGSTGAVLGSEFGDTFGYTDVTEKLEQYKVESKSFQGLLSHLKDNGVNYIDEKDLSHLMQISQQRTSQGIGKGYLAKYFDDKIKPEIDSRVDVMRGKVVNRVPKDVDFYAMHGMPNGPHAGIEEIAALKAIDAQGGNILHGHQHGNTTHRQGKSLLLNQGNGQAFGAYLYDNKSKKVNEMLTRTYNKNLGDFEFDLINANQIGVRKSPKEYD